jgi:hypothetical protein
MTREEIVKHLNRKIKDALEKSKRNGVHNNKTLSCYYNGVTKGIKDAKSLIGMLDEQNNRL